MEQDPAETVGDRRIRAERRDGTLERILVEPANPPTTPEWAVVDAPTRRRLGAAPMRRALSSLRERIPRPKPSPEPEPAAEPLPVPTPGASMRHDPLETIRRAEQSEDSPTPLAPVWAKMLNLDRSARATTAVPAIDRVVREPEPEVVPQCFDALDEGEVPEETALEHRVDAILAARGRR